MMNTPFEQGSQAFMNDRPTSDCNFAPGSTMGREWIEGWSDRQVSERRLRSRAVGEPHIHDGSIGPHGKLRTAKAREFHNLP